jgi:hypothetical protein
MARNLYLWQRKMIVHMIRSKNRFTTPQMAKLAKYSERAITTNTQEHAVVGQSQISPIPPGRPLSITPVMLDALYDRLAEKPGLYVEEMTVFL